MMGKAAEAIKAVERLTYDCEEQLGKSSSVTNLLSVSLASASCQAGDFDRAHRLLMPRLDSACLRSEEHTSELQSLMRNSYAVFCSNNKKSHTSHNSGQLSTTHSHQ